MDVNALRIWGIAVSAALLVAAIALAVIGTGPNPTSAQTAYETAQAEPSAPALASVGFVVRFRGDGPIARAQALAAQAGQAQAGQAQAGRQVEAQLRRQSAFNGLCFDRFTIGAAEIVLRSCDEIPASARAAFQTRWLARLNAMASVEYADANSAATQERAPG